MHKNTLLPKRYDLIIFDCDGTLADSEPAHNKALSAQLSALGLTEYTPDYCMQTFMGTAMPAIMRLIEDKHDITLPADFLDDNIRRVVSSLPTEMVLEGTTEGVLQNLSHNKGMKIAVGSNGQRAIVLEILKAAGFDRFFPENHVFTFEDVANPKPAPDLYLHICEKMQCAPENALVIEDTVKGALGGINAGIDTIGYVGLAHKDNQAQRLKDTGCIHIISRMAELSDFLERQSLAA